MNMIDAMRGGQLPTQLIFSLSALHLHGYEPVALRYFKLDDAGEIHYLTDADVAADRRDQATSERTTAGSASVELRFRKIGGTHEQVYRHIVANLDDAHLRHRRRALSTSRRRVTSRR